MRHAWFIHIDDKVSGPFDTETVRSRLVTGEIPASSFIWWKGQREWLPVANWEAQLDSLLRAENDQALQPIWYFENGYGPVGPLSRTELLEQLNRVSTLSKVRLWSVGMHQWRSLFELSDVMEWLGISRREAARAPLMGSALVSRSNEDPRGFMLKTASISMAGMGITGEHDLRVNDEISLFIKSSEFNVALQLRGTVVYVTATNYAGIRFSEMPEAYRPMISNYIYRFQEDVARAKSA